MPLIRFLANNDAASFAALPASLICFALFPLLVCPAANVRGADATAWPVPDWATAMPESQGLSTDGVDKVRDWLKENGSKMGLLVPHGRSVGEWYFGGAQPSSQYLVYSTSKSFASTATAKTAISSSTPMRRTLWASSHPSSS